MRWMRGRAARGCLVGLCLLDGCTAPSNRLAREASQRSDEVRSAVVDRQHGALLGLSFRETLARLNAAGSDDQRQEALNAAWNDRDLYEFWRLQDVYARALHYAGVDAYLASQQGIATLLARDLARRSEGAIAVARDALVDQAAEAAIAAATTRPAGEAR